MGEWCGQTVPFHSAFVSPPGLAAEQDLFQRHNLEVFTK